MAEGLVSLAVKLWQGLGPLDLNHIENIRRNAELRATRVDDGRVTQTVFPLHLHLVACVGHALALEGPGSQPVGEVLEGLKSLVSINNLGRVVASEKRIWSFTLLVRRDTEANNGIVNDAVVLERPEVVQFLLAHVFVGRESKDTI